MAFKVTPTGFGAARSQGEDGCFWQGKAHMEELRGREELGVLKALSGYQVAEHSEDSEHSKDVGYSMRRI